MKVRMVYQMNRIWVSAFVLSVGLAALAAQPRTDQLASLRAQAPDLLRSDIDDAQNDSSGEFESLFSPEIFAKTEHEPVAGGTGFSLFKGRLYKNNYYRVVTQGENPDRDHTIIDDTPADELGRRQPFIEVLPSRLVFHPQGASDVLIQSLMAGSAKILLYRGTGSELEGSYWEFVKDLLNNPSAPISPQQIAAGDRLIGQFAKRRKSTLVANWPNLRTRSQSGRLNADQLATEFLGGEAERNSPVFTTPQIIGAGVFGKMFDKRGERGRVMEFSIDASAINPQVLASMYGGIEYEGASAYIEIGFVKLAAKKALAKGYMATLDDQEFYRKAKIPYRN